MATGIELITAKRASHAAKGYDADHDDKHGHGDLGLAAALLAVWRRVFVMEESAAGWHFVDPWPWTDWDPRPFIGNVVQHNSTLRHAERIDQLATAGALIAAEIDRLQRIPAEEYNRYRVEADSILEE